jgi:hypothetical protein
MSSSRSLSRSGGCSSGNLTNRGKDIFRRAQAEHLDELTDVLRVAGPGGECLHRKQVLRRGSEHPEAGMVEHPGCRRIPARGDIRASLLIQPPPGQAKLGRDGQCLFMHDAVRFEQRIHVAGSPPGVVGEGHGGAAEYVEVGDHAAPGEPLTEAAESVLEGRPVEQRRGIAHAASIS